MGGSDPVVVDNRMDVWLETVPILLRKLSVKHVSLMCHSAGAIYLFNTLHAHREFLDPRAPSAVLIAPWVPAAEATTLYANILRYLPAGLIKAQHALAKLFVAPSSSFQWSSAVSAGLLDMSMPSAARKNNSTALEAERFNCDKATAKEISRLSSDYVWAEETKAMNDEALFCLHKTGPGSWGVCEDFSDMIQQLVRKEAQIEPRPTQKLSIQAFFAESDELIGNGGQKFLEKCFAQGSVADMIDFKSTVKAGTDHNSVLINHRTGGIIEALEQIANALRS